MSENKRKRTDDHYVPNFKLQPVQNRSHPSQSVIQQPLVVSSDQLIDGEHIQLLDGNVDANNQNLVYILLPPGTNQTQNVLQGVQTVLLVPKEDQPTSENPPQLHYYVPPDKGKKDDDVVFVKDLKVFKDEQEVPVQYIQDPAVDPLQIQTIQDGHNVSYTVVPQYEPNQLGNVVVVNDQYQKPQQPQPQPDDNLKYKMQFKCDYPGCYLTFPSVYEKKVHAETHLFPTSSEFKCGICGMVFDRALDRNKHVDTHAVINTYKCKTCEKTFPYYTTLVRHVNEDKCASTRPHSCHYCGVQFVDVNDLEKHQKENTKHCVCHAKMCSEQAFELHTTWCTVYKQKIGKGKANKSRKVAKPSDVIVLE